jgi:hypothetical protein
MDQPKIRCQVPASQVAWVASDRPVPLQPGQRVSSFGLRISDFGFQSVGWRSNARVLRGGSWNNNARNARAANRNRNHPDNRNHNRGVRVVLGVGASTPRGPRPGSAPAGRLWPELHAPRPVQARRCASPDRRPVSACAVAPAPEAGSIKPAQGESNVRPAKPQTVPWGLVGGHPERPHGTLACPGWILRPPVYGPTLRRVGARGLHRPKPPCRPGPLTRRFGCEQSRLVASRCRP